MRVDKRSFCSAHHARMIFEKATRTPAHRVLRLSACLMGLIGAFFSLSACQSEGPDVGVTVGEIESNPDRYFGQRVIVSGDIDDVYDPSFSIGGQGFQGELLVVVPPGAQISGAPPSAEDPPYAEDDIVQVTGTVRPFLVSDIEDELGMDLESNIDYEERDPAVVAERVAITPRVGGGSNADTTGVASGSRRLK